MRQLTLQKLATLAEDEIELTRLIWPSKAPSAPDAYFEGSMGEVAEPIAPPESTENDLAGWSAIIQEQGKQRREAQPVEPSQDEKIDALLKMTLALTENVIWLRERVEALNSVACSHCEYPEAHK